MRLVFASNNAHKLAEVRQIMPSNIDVVSLHDVGFEQEIEETGETLSENSRIKAETVWEFLKQQNNPTINGVFADDTGLEIDALSGEPGVYTGRWCMRGEGAKAPDELLSEHAIFTANRAKALRELDGKTQRGAQFKTVITLIREGKPTVQVEGIVRGRIATEEYGQGGFGYDPLFIPEGYDKTFGELPADVKNRISHRARALEKLKLIVVN